MSLRVQRVNASIQEILAEVLPTLKDPRIGFVTITDVRASSDLTHAEVFYTVLPDDLTAREETAAGLQSATPLLRREVGGRLRVKRVPDLHFVHDPVPERGRRIEGLIGEARRQEQAAQAEQTGGHGDA